MATDAMLYVVDDDPSVLASVQAVLAAHGYAAECFSSGEEFFDRMDPGAVGCVITDLQMPGIQGTEVQEQLRTKESDLSVIVVSGVADVSTAVRIMEHGAVTLLEKPYQPAALLAAVERGITRSRESRSRRLQVRAVQERLSRLSDEERDVMEAMLAGKPNKAISAALTISLRTVDRRRQSVLEKMQAGSVAELASMMAVLAPQNPPA
jgi:two-component system, LuxR family, response regulator FixJ